MGSGPVEKNSHYKAERGGSICSQVLPKFYSQSVAEYKTGKPENCYGVMSIDFSKSGSLMFAGLDSGHVIGWDVPAVEEVGENSLIE